MLHYRIAIFEKLQIEISKAIYGQFPYHVETSPSVYSTIQLTGLYMTGTLTTRG